MGILNITPDSFSDGNLFLSQDKALMQAEKMVVEGADIIDIGGESSRPGSKRVSQEEELERIAKITEAVIDRFDLPVSIDTYKAGVAEEVLKLGTAMINDIYGLTKSPEIADLCAFLTKRGAKILGAGTDTITIEGVSELHGAKHKVMADRVEAGTFVMAGAITGGDLTVKGCITDHLGNVFTKIQEMGVELTESSEGVRVRRFGPLKAVEVKTLPYPGFPTDLQAQMMALMSVADGTSIMTETIFEGRFLHVPELHRMGASIEIDGPHAVVKGIPALTGAPVMASDLRASAGLVLAGLAAEGETTVSRVYHLDRGYERLEEKLKAVGAQVQRVQEVV